MCLLFIQLHHLFLSLFRNSHPANDWVTNKVSSIIDGVKDCVAYSVNICLLSSVIQISLCVIKVSKNLNQLTHSSLNHYMNFDLSCTFFIHCVLKNFPKIWLHVHQVSLTMYTIATHSVLGMSMIKSLLLNLFGKLQNNQEKDICRGYTRMTYISPLH